MKNYRKLAEEIHKTNQEKGFWDKKRNPDEVFALIVTELSECIEAHREGKWSNRDSFEKSNDGSELSWKLSFQGHIKDTVEDELADVIIRCLDWLYFRYREYVMIPDINVEWEDNFAANIFKIMKRVCDKEVAYAFSYTLEFAEIYSIDIYWHVNQKMKYNKTRKKMHGKEY